MTPPSLHLPGTSPLRELAGAVLAGGASRRMGMDKALVEVGGEPLWCRQTRVLRELGAAPVVIVRNPAQPPLPAINRQVRDRCADAGPLAGIEAALATCAAAWLAVLAIDLPAIEASCFERLLTECAPGVGAVVRSRNGYEPLAAIYPQEALSYAEEHLRKRTLSLQAFVTALVECGKMRVLPADEPILRQLTNCNRPQDLTAFTSRPVPAQEPLTGDSNDSRSSHQLHAPTADLPPSPSQL